MVSVLEKHRKKNVLVVDDDKIYLDILTSVIQKKSRNTVNIIRATNGSDGLNKYNNFNPDLVITDMRMPRMNGVDLIKRIKEQCSDEKVFTMSCSIDERRNLEPEDMVRFFDKLGVDELVTAILNNLSKKDTQRRIKDVAKISKRVAKATSKNFSVSKKEKMSLIEKSIKILNDMDLSKTSRAVDEFEKVLDKYNVAKL